MSSEDQEILAKISQLAGKINRHKNGQDPNEQTQFQRPRTNSYDAYHQSSTSWQSGRGGYNPRGSVRGGRGRAGRLHHHRTLILNNNNSETPASTVPDNQENVKPSGQPSSSSSAWVTKNDRHLQLINTAVFAKESQQRAKDIEETRQQKLRQKDEREKRKFANRLQRSGHIGHSSSASRSINGTTVDIEGIPFRVTKNGDRLMKVAGDPHPPSATPKTTMMWGVRFIRSKKGNLYRIGIIKAQRYEIPSFDRIRTHPYCFCADTFNPRRKMGIQKIQEPCKMFTTTGSCSKGPNCRYIHDPAKVAVCKEVLHKGTCPSGDTCDLSHELTPERTPACLHFAKGNCSNPDCRYTHVRVSPLALVCREFGIYGYCNRGATCTERHVNECPDFSNTGTCTTKGCKLLHRHKASVMRTNTTRSNQSGEDESSDISSDEDGDEIGDDDVDSDDLEEFFGDEDGNVDSDIPMQQDYVQLS